MIRPIASWRQHQLHCLALVPLLPFLLQNATLLAEGSRCLFLISLVDFLLKMSSDSRRSFLFPSFYLLALSGTLMMTGPSQTKNREYISPDRGARVVIVPVGKEAGRLEYESRIEFRSAENLLCTIDYSSEDSEHGFGVVKAEWTADSQYFVFSLTSSGGHQTWHAPTQFYSRKDGIVRTLDDYFRSGITDAKFRLIAPNTVQTEILEGTKSLLVSVRLDAPPALRSWRRNKPFSLSCKGGTSVKVDQP